MQNFTVDERTFSQIPTAGAAKAWRCEASGIRISQRLRPAGDRWEYIATRIVPDRAGTQFLERRGHVRTFVNAPAAAKAALTEWM
jgi:hypothetical protein